jgi:hypothetical protein
MLVLILKGNYNLQIWEEFLRSQHPNRLTPKLGQFTPPTLIFVAGPGNT